MKKWIDTNDVRYEMVEAYRNACDPYAGIRAALEAAPEAAPTSLTNSNGIDAKYFEKNLRAVFEKFSSYTPDELARTLIRLANVADDKVICEADFSKIAQDVEPVAYRVAITDHAGEIMWWQLESGPIEDLQKRFNPLQAEPLYLHPPRLAPDVVERIKALKMCAGNELYAARNELIDDIVQIIEGAK